MRWFDTRERLPQIEQAYVVSITIDNYTFKAIAFFENRNWFYSIKGEKGEQIVDQINGWVEDLGIYIR